ncbi:MAG: putative glutamine amidotransferase [Bacteroidales bacterium]|nr:putative glutamine amidotransferase [Bacteroidales bacterium]
MRNLIFVALLFLVALTLTSCKGKHTTLIAVTKLSDNYKNWLLSADSTIKIIDLYELSRDSADEIMQQADGLLVTGGEDVYPDWYGKENDTAQCESFDRTRDTLEMTALRIAFDRKIPVLGICRGLQIINVYLGGTLLTHLPKDIGDDVAHRCPDPLNCLHPVSVQPHTLLHRLSGFNEGIVNSNHHQGIDQLAIGLKPAAFSPDRLIEAIEWEEPKGNNWFLAVQWHPERLKENPAFSEPLAKEFIKQAQMTSHP